MNNCFVLFFSGPSKFQLVRVYEDENRAHEDKQLLEVILGYNKDGTYTVEQTDFIASKPILSPTPKKGKKV